MPGDGARVQNLGHLQNVLFTVFFFSEQILIGMYSYLDHRYFLGFNFSLWHQTPRVGLEVII